MLDVFKSKIVKLLRRRDYKPVKLNQLAKSLGVESDSYPQFKKAFDDLKKSGQVVLGSGNFVMLPSISNKIVGKFRANPKGFGFVIPTEANTHGDLFIPAKETAGAMTGDMVEARVLKKGVRTGEMRYSGKIVEILERSQNKFVGTLMRKSKQWYVVPDGSTFTDPVSVEDVAAKNAQPKDKVVVEILTYPSDDYFAHGVILEVLGKAGKYDTEIAAVIEQFHLPKEFDEECLNQARQATESFDANADVREDITDKVTVTIDPPDAKDFDDAITLEKAATGNGVLGVHIADVSHFVTMDSPLDIEAKNRGNSIYLPLKTIPMLPEVLSNGVCSLQPNQKRFCKSVYITYDDDGEILTRRFANSVMRSSARLTYIQADRICKGHKKDFAPEVVQLVKDMKSLANVIERRRHRNGMLHLALRETELIFDKSGQVIDAEPAEDSYPHTIIEMFMVEANEAAAGLIDKLNVPFMRRIHPEPNELSLKELARQVKTLGVSLGKNPDRFSLQGMLESVAGRDCELAVNMLVLRSLEKAEYSAMNMGHYALAGRYYCHFTSPIRRYADLMVHRILDAHIREKSDIEDKNIDLSEVGRHISFTERRAEDAERELKTVLLLNMLSKRVGDDLDGVVTGMASFGVFLRCQKFGVEGLIPIEELGHDGWSFNQKGYCIVGANSGYNIHLGDKIRARIVSVNIPARQLNLIPVEPLVSKSVSKREKGGRKYPRKRRGGRKI